MSIEDLFELYQKEREYQNKVFGDYTKNPSLNISSFINFIEEYLNKAKKSYVYEWTPNIPPWFLESKETNENKNAPVKTYEYLIKVFALTGAALETYLVVEPSNWRTEGVKEKWKKK